MFLEFIYSVSTCTPVIVIVSDCRNLLMCMTSVMHIIIISSSSSSSCSSNNNSSSSNISIMIIKKKKKKKKKKGVGVGAAKSFLEIGGLKRPVLKPNSVGACGKRTNESYVSLGYDASVSWRLVSQS